MTRNNPGHADTRRRLLDAAVILFASKGFRNAKTADICKMAQANVAAVNYHFGSKEELYVAAWRHEFERSLADYPPDGGVAPEAMAEERLRGHIMASVRRFMDPASRDLDIADREMADPTGLLAEVMHRSIDPIRRMHAALVRKLLGPQASAQEVELCVMSIHAQCFAALMHERRRRLAPPQLRRKAPPGLRVNGATLTEHIVRFSLAGISAVRTAIEAAKLPARQGALWETKR